MRVQPPGRMPPLEGVSGVSGIVTIDGRLTCQLEGDVGPFLKAIAGYSISDLTIEPAHLEEAFLELYEDTRSPGPSGAPLPARHLR
jgi:hypothetical protein